MSITNPGCGYQRFSPAYEVSWLVPSILTQMLWRRQHLRQLAGPAVRECEADVVLEHESHGKLVLDDVPRRGHVGQGAAELAWTPEELVVAVPAACDVGLCHEDAVDTGNTRRALARQLRLYKAPPALVAVHVAEGSTN